MLLGGFAFEERGGPVIDVPGVGVLQGNYDGQGTYGTFACRGQQSASLYVRMYVSFL